MHDRTYSSVTVHARRVCILVLHAVTLHRRSVAVFGVLCKGCRSVVDILWLNTVPLLFLCYEVHLWYKTSLKWLCILPHLYLPLSPGLHKSLPCNDTKNIWHTYYCHLCILYIAPSYPAKAIFFLNKPGQQTKSNYVGQLPPGSG